VTKQADLIAYLFDGQPHLLSAELLRWLNASPRFIDFVGTYRDKIRKKIRVTRQPERVLDLSSELQVACCLLNDRRLSVAYEPYASEKRRGPDFAVTYRANLVFNVEVARIHAHRQAATGVDNPPTIELLPAGERLLRTLLGKLGQTQPGMPNLLVIHTGDEPARRLDLSRLMQGVKTRAEAKDPAFFALGRYDGPSAFFKDYLRLSGVLLWADDVQPWVNKQARPPLDEKILRIVATTLWNKD
jgi:hypothetical protein